MRISTSMIYDSGVAAMQRKSTDLLRIQQQVASGRRILAPSDDPVAAAQALEVTQAQNLNTQYTENQGNAKDALSLSSAQLQSASDLIQRVRSLAVQLGSPTLSQNDRNSVATSLRQEFDSLLGIANQTDGGGNYLYSGFRGSTQPFGGSVDTGVTYSGDDGQRLIQVSGSQQLAVSDSGRDIFMSANAAAEPFAVAADPLNKGSGAIGAATITDANKWNVAGNDKNFSIKFAYDNSAAPPLTTYDIVDDQGMSVLTGAASALAATGGAYTGFRYPATYAPGAAIDLKSLAPNIDFGARVTITGSPANGDTFTLKPSAPISAFQTIADLVHAAEGTGGGALADHVTAALANLDSTQESILRVSSTIGARLSELQSLGSLGGQMNLNYKDTLSRLQDVDYAKAITDLNQNQLNLQAAQQSFSKVAALSLFNFL